MQQATTTFSSTFTPDRENSKKIRGLAEFNTYSNNNGLFGIDIKPGIGFPAIRKLFELRSLNSRLHLAALVTNKLANTKVTDIELITNGYINLPDGKKAPYKIAQYRLKKGAKLKTVEAFIAKAGKRIIVLASENKIDLKQAQIFSENVYF